MDHTSSPYLTRVLDDFITCAAAAPSSVPEQ